MKFDELVRAKLKDGAMLEGNDNAQLDERDFEAILTIVRKINSSLELSAVLELVVDEAIRIAKADRGFLMLKGKEGKLEYSVGRNSKGESIGRESFQISFSVPEDVFATGESFCVENALDDERFEQRMSIMNLSLQTILCAPLTTHDENIGVIYVDSKAIQAVDKSSILHRFELLAEHAALAIKNARLYADVKLTFEQLKQANLHIIHYERLAMKGEIAGEISHELKNLVSVVLLSLQSLQSGLGIISVAEITKVIETIIAGVKKIERFSRSLLTQSPIGARPRPHNLNKIIADFVETMGFLPRFKATTTHLRLDESLPMMRLDIDQIQQVLLNLMNNIVEARNDASIVMRTEYSPQREEVVLAVSDNGPGVDNEVVGRLFVERVTSKREGHGYGLNVCRQIIESHGGHIRVSSKKHEGATFLITLPVRENV